MKKKKKIMCGDGCTDYTRNQDRKKEDETPTAMGTECAMPQTSNHHALKGMCLLAVGEALMLTVREPATNPDPSRQPAGLGMTFIKPPGGSETQARLTPPLTGSSEGHKALLKQSSSQGAAAGCFPCSLSPPVPAASAGEVTADRKGPQRGNLGKVR